MEVKLGEDPGQEQPVRCGDEASERPGRATTRRRRAGGVEARWRLLEQQPVCEAAGGASGVGKSERSAAGLFVTSMVTFSLFSNGNGGVACLSAKGFMGCRPIPGVAGFSFSGLFSHLV